MARRDRKASKWIDLFEEFVQHVRIDSKEVNSEDDTGVELDLWTSQKLFLRSLADGLENGIRTFVCLKSRQLGITTINLVIDIYWLAMFPSTKGALVVDSDENRDDFRRSLRRIIKSAESFFGDDFKLIKGGDNRTGMTFSNGSKLVFLTAGKTKTKKNWGEGKGFSFVHASECSKYGSGEGFQNFEEAWAQTNPNRLFILESTANGFNWWRDRYLLAKQDTHTQRAFFIGWWASAVNRIEKNDPRWLDFCAPAPDGEEAELIRIVREQHGIRVTAEQLGWYRWKQTQAAQTGSTVLDQNQPWHEGQAFIQPGFSFFQTRKITKDIERLGSGGEDEASYEAYIFHTSNDFFDMQMNRVTGESLIEDYGSLEEGIRRIHFRVWQPPVVGAAYAIGFDPAWGRTSHKDRHAISIWRCFADKLLQVAEFAANDMEVKQAAWIAAVIAGAYDDCMINIELDGPGRIIMPEWDHIRAMMKADHIADYVQRVKKWGWDDALNNARWYLYHRPDSIGPGFAYNFESSQKRVAEMMHSFRAAYSTDHIAIRSVKLLEEMMNVVQDGDHIGAPDSENESQKDDRVFAACLAHRTWEDHLRKRMLAEGRLYLAEMQKEAGTVPKRIERLNNIWFNYFQRRKAEEDQYPDRRPAWMVERGLA